jgi:CRISPR/Cas system CSM-associated protein Csm3 (group 7 of RAMP superfamily)
LESKALALYDLKLWTPKSQETTKMLANQPILYIARIVIETSTPLSISAGRGDGTFDNLLVRDANNLPTIPGTSLAGVLRSLYQSEYSKELTNELFGYSKKDKQDKEQVSFVHVSYGCIHNSKNEPIEGLETNPDKLKQDNILADALQLTPIVRDHVRLTHRGIAKDQGKFDRTSLRKGHRFTIELSLWSDNPEDERWNNLLALLNRPNFRLGGATRRGLGALKLICSSVRKFNLKNPEDFAEYNSNNFSLELGNTTGFTQKKLPTNKQFPQAKISITPRDGYRFGQGTQAFGIDEADLVPISEKVIEWQNNHGTISQQRRLVIPASAVKGALSHRIAFHYNGLTNYFADKISEKELQNYEKETNEAVKDIFGYLKDDKSGQIGHLLLDDLYITTPVQAIKLQHNSVDRFTGGVREHMLFNEEIITQETPLELTLTVITKKPFEIKVRQALKKTLDDLINGRLALGAGSGRGGYGYFQGTLEWTDKGTWIKG